MTDKKQLSIRERMDALSKSIDWDRQNNKSMEMINDGVKSIKDHIEKNPDPPRKKLLFSFMPTNMARVSPFFPMSKKQMKARPYEKGLEWEHNWGKINISGERLNLFDETILLNLLYLVARNKTETIETTQYELCQIGKVTPCPNTYNAIHDSIKRLRGTDVSIEIWEGKGKNRKLKRELGGSIIIFTDRVEKTGKLQIAMNPYFVKMFAESFVTSIDLDFRANLKTDVAKSLYRFYRSQKGDHFQCHMLTIAKAVNLNTDMPAFKIREQLRKGLRELRVKGFLDRWTLPPRSEIVNIWKAIKAIK